MSSNNEEYQNKNHIIIQGSGGLCTKGCINEGGEGGQGLREGDQC